MDMLIFMFMLIAIINAYRKQCHTGIIHYAMYNSLIHEGIDGPVERSAVKAVGQCIFQVCMLDGLVGIEKVFESLYPGQG